MKFLRRARGFPALRPAPHGAGGLKYGIVRGIGKRKGPAPHGAGGLK